VIAYVGKLWETRIESRDLPITSPTNDVSRSSESEAHAAASGPRRAAPGPRRTASEQAYGATSAFTVRRPREGFNRRNSLEALWAAGFTDMDSSFVTSSNFAALDQDELADALRNGGVRHGCYSITVRKDANGVESVEIICYNCFGLGHTVRSCPSPKKSCELDFVIETLNELNKNRKQNPRAGPPNRVPYGQKPRNGKETAWPARRQPTKFNKSGARVAVQEDECSVCSDDESSQSDYAGSILPTPARWVAHAASARATASGAGTSNLSFTGASAGELFSDEDGETDAEGAADAFTVHHAYAAPAANAREPLIDTPAPTAVPVLAAPYADELNYLGLLPTTSRSWRASMSWEAIAATRLDLNSVAPVAEPEPAEPHNGWLDARDGPNEQWAAEEWQAEIKANHMSSKYDDEPEIDGYGYFAQCDSDLEACVQLHDDVAASAQDDPGDLELGQIDAGAIFAQCGIDDVGPWPDIPEREFRLPRPVPEGTDFASRCAARAGLLPDPDFAEPDPVETHKKDIRSDAASTTAPCAIPLCPEKVPSIDDFFDGLVAHHALLGVCSGDERCRILLDSGATSSCIAKNNKMLKALCTAVVDPSPNAGVKVGSA